MAVTWRRDFGLVVVLTVASCASVTSAAEPARPNILWLIAEDMGPELGCYGEPEARTPNLDKLASEGVRYTRLFCVSPVCSPSRSAFMTGMYATTLGAHHHRSNRGVEHVLPEGVRLITDWLRPAGYFTANVRAALDAEGFQGTGKTDCNFHYEKGWAKAFDSDRWADLKGHQPFYAQVNFSLAHRGKDWERAQDGADHPADPAKVRLSPYHPDHPESRRDWAAYLNVVMAMDAQVGAVLKRLEAEGLADSTVVVFFADNGRPMLRGKQWPYESGLHVPLIIRWPGGFGAPAGFKPGTVDDRLLQSLDITATALSLAGVRPPQLMQGRVFLGDAAAPPRQYTFGGRDRGDETVFRMRTVRDARYRYLRNFTPDRPFFQLNRDMELHYPVIDLMRRLHAEGKLTAIQERLMGPTMFAEELYDLESDPYETKNLVGSTHDEHREKLIELRAALETWITETNDQGRFPEPPEVADYVERHMSEGYDPKLRARPESHRRMVEQLGLGR